MAAQLRSTLRRAFAPEARWRRPDPVFRSMTIRLSELFAVSLYDLSPIDRSDIAQFYSSRPATATFIVFRSIEEANLQLDESAQEVTAANSMAERVLERIFTEQGCAHLLEIFQLFLHAKPTETDEIRLVARILAVASVKVAEATRQLKDFSSLVTLGAELAKRDPELSNQPTVFQAWIAKHWEFCGGPLEREFEQWYVAHRLQQATQRAAKTLFSRDDER